MKKVLFGTLGLILLCAASASAGTGTADMAVSALVLNVCTVITP